MDDQFWNLNKWLDVFDSFDRHPLSWGRRSEMAIIIVTRPCTTNCTEDGEVPRPLVTSSSAPVPRSCSCKSLTSLQVSFVVTAYWCLPDLCLLWWLMHKLMWSGSVLCPYNIMKDLIALWTSVLNIFITN